jgi:hypothetical protein
VPRARHQQVTVASPPARPRPTADAPSASNGSP